MIYYAKTSLNGTFEAALELFKTHGISAEDVIWDNSVVQKNSNSVFQKIKTDLLKSHDTLVIDSVNSLGKNNREISKELNWFRQNNIPLFILSVPTSLENSTSAINTLTELYSSLAAIEINNVKTQQKIGIAKARANNTTFGRKRIPYPDNWAENYCLWKEKKITANEFMEATKLKKGTLYNLIKQYKDSEAVAKNA